MFVQTLEGDVGDAEAFMAQIDRWKSELMPEAAGFLGATAGMTDSGKAFVAARFETEAAARANQERPESTKWWANTATYFTDSAKATETSAASETPGGVLDDPSLVVVIHAEVIEPDRHHELREIALARSEQNMSLMFLDYPDHQMTMLSYLQTEEDSTTLSPALAALSVEVASTIRGTGGLRLISPRMITP